MWFFTKKKFDIPSEPRKTVSIRLEAIGGQGAHSAGKIIAEAAVLKSGFTGNHFSSFGSEKRGTPVKSFVRFSTEKKPIRTASHIQYPDVLVVFHSGLMISHPEVLDGAHDQTDLIINSELAPEELNFPEGSRFRSITTIDATKLAQTANCGVNAVMLGVISHFCFEVTQDDISKTLEEFFAKKGSVIVKNNLKGFNLGFKNMKTVAFRESRAHIEKTNSPLPEMGWMNAPIGGVIINPGNSVLKDHSGSRKGIAPRLFKEICFNCGLCDMVCPDFCFVWDIQATETNSQGEQVVTPALKGIDYQYCKGCQKCVAVCPVEALQPVNENEIPENEKSVKAYAEMNRQDIENRWKHLDWTAFVDRLSENDRMLTLQTELLDPKSYIKPEFPKEILEMKNAEKKK